MVKNNNILIPMLLIVAILLTGCSRNKEIQEFPIGEDGYPKESVVLINGNSYELKNYDKVLSGSIGESEVFIDSQSEQLEILLSVVGVLTEWSAEESEKISLINYAILDTDIKTDKIKDGGSAAIQKFVFDIQESEKATIVFKHINISEKVKAFSNRQYDYLLKITFKGGLSE